MREPRKAAHKDEVCMATASTTPVPVKKGRFWRITKRILQGILALVVLAAVCGAAYQAIANWRDSRRFPQEGRSIALGAAFSNVSLNMDCSGQGSPTVILDTGLGVPAAGWKFVQPEVAKFARVCSYDRAGYGWSTPGPLPRTSGQIVRELHALLAASGEKGPFVLVAHSFAGFNVRVYTKEYPADVAGLVLVDTSHEDQESRMTGTLQTFMKSQTAQLEFQRKVAPILIFFGIARITAGDEGPPNLPKSFLQEVKYLQLQPKFVEATASEIQNFSASANEVRASGNLGERPLLVLTAGKEEDLKDLPKGLEKRDLDEFLKIWMNDLQVQEAHLSTRGKQVIVPDSTHMIPFLRPDTVVTAIREVREAVKAQPAAKP
jgi:pimeloyl-ACP methyl ester carboxylesterase